MSAPEVRPGQEWEKRHNDGPSSPPTRIRIVSITTATALMRARALVESQINDGWGRRRFIALSRLNNRPSGYRLVEEGTMIAKAISFKTDVLKAKLRALEEYGRCMARRPVRRDWVEWMGEPDGWKSAGDGTFRAFDHMEYETRHFHGPFGAGGSVLWVRERARVVEFNGLGGWVRLRYALDNALSGMVAYPSRLRVPTVGNCLPNGVHREGARHFLEVVEVRAERASEISEQDALMEGVLPIVSEHWTAYDPETDGYPSFGVEPDAEMIARRRLENVRHHGPTVLLTATQAFHRLYDSIYGNGAHSRDWCWVYTLKRAEP